MNIFICASVYIVAQAYYDAAQRRLAHKHTSKSQSDAPSLTPAKVCLSVCMQVKARGFYDFVYVRMHVWHPLRSTQMLPCPHNGISHPGIGPSFAFWRHLSVCVCGNMVNPLPHGVRMPWNPCIPCIPAPHSTRLCSMYFSVCHLLHHAPLC